MKINVLENGIAITRDMTEEEEREYFNNEQIAINEQISELKRRLSESDYKALKFAEGWITEEDYAPIKSERQFLRNKINELEELKND